MTSPFLLRLLLSEGYQMPGSDLPVRIIDLLSIQLSIDADIIRHREG